MHFNSIYDTDYVVATALGGFTRGASALEMAAGYATLENDGVYRQPTCIKKIVDAAENIVYVSKQEGSQIYRETASRMMTDVLQSVMKNGTGKDAILEGMPCAGKTGTTNDYKDGWFVGYTRYYTTSVWVGYDLPRGVEGLKGATYPAQIWKDYMTTIHAELAPMNFLPYAQLSPEFMDEHYPQESESEEQSESGDVSEENAQEGETLLEEEPEV